MTDADNRLARLEQWRAARWRDDDLYKKLPLVGERNLVEPTVVSILPYFLRPGDICFDVGSQAGHVAHAMSGLVGPKGLVVAFEASMRTARKLLINITDANLRNIELVHAAICARGGERLKLYLHRTQNNDSLFPESLSPSGVFSEDRYVFVETLSLDEYCEKWNIWPRLLKFDIEGAEYEALNGASRLLQSHRPVVLIEDFDATLKCFDLLLSHGYHCIDLITLKRLNRAERAASHEANFLFVHESEVLPGLFDRVFQLHGTIRWPEFSSTNQAGLRVSAPLHLAPQTRYVVRWNFSDAGNVDALGSMIGVLDFKNEMIARYQANVALLKKHYTELPFESGLDDYARLFVWTSGQPDAEVLKSAELLVFSAE